MKNYTTIYKTIVMMAIAVLLFASITSCVPPTRVAKYDGIKVKYTVDENGQYTALKVSSYNVKKTDPNYER